ncbi:Uncharacterised protein [uncultured archaeon]|nr:Uncharacterised protein [uncultured archaeon]
MNGDSATAKQIHRQDWLSDLDNQLSALWGAHIRVIDSQTGLMTLEEVLDYYKAIGFLRQAVSDYEYWRNKPTDLLVARKYPQVVELHDNKNKTVRYGILQIIL